MKVKGAKNNASAQQSQGVTPGKQLAESMGGQGSNLRQEFQGILATFAGQISDSSSSISLDTFQVEGLKLEAAPAPIEKSAEPTAVQTAMQASTVASTKRELGEEMPERNRESTKDFGQTSQSEPVEADHSTPATVNAASDVQKTTAAPVAATEQESESAPLAQEAASQGLTSEQLTDAELAEVSEQATGEKSYAQPQNQAPLSETTSSEEVAAGATQDAPAEVQEAALESAPTEAPEHVESADRAHPVTQPKAAEPHAEAKQGAAVAAGHSVTPTLKAPATRGEEPLGQSVKEQVHQAIANFRESFAPAEVAPQDTAQSNPAIPVLAQMLRHSLATEIVSSIQKATESATQSSNFERTAAAAQQGSNPIAALGAASSARSSGGMSDARPSRPLPPGQATRVLERVEQTLKEVARSKDGKSISLTLTPNDLGTVKVDVTLKQGTLHARLGAETAQVSQLLRDRAPELQAMLRKLGLNVDQVTVSVHSEGQSFSQMHDQLERHDSQRGNQGGNNGSGASFAGTALPATVVAQEQATKLDHWVA